MKFDTWCNPDSNGSIKICASGGTGQIQESLSGTMSLPYQNNCAIFTNLTFGSYLVTIKDANGCSITTNVSLAQPNAISVTATSTAEWCVPASNGTITATVVGGNGSLLYGTTSTPINPSNLLSGYTAGNYVVTVKDVKACTATTNITVNHTVYPVINAPITTTTASCSPGCDAHIVVPNVTGTSIMYSFNNGTYTTLDSITNACAGLNTIIVKDTYGCMDTATVNISTANAPAFTLISVTPTGCNPNNTGKIVISVTGPSTIISTTTLPYVYSQVGNQVTFDSLTNQCYTFKASDINNCVAFDTVCVGVTSSPVIDSLVKTDVLCNGGNTGTIKVYAGNGTGTLSDSIITPVAFIINYASGNLFSNLPINTYNITVTDVKGCKDTSTITIAQPAASSFASVVATKVKCHGDHNGSIVATLTGGTLLYTYKVSPAPFGAPDSNNTGNFNNNLYAGTYTITAHDAHNCSISTTVIVDSVLPITFNAAIVNNVKCHGDSNGQIHVTATGGNLNGMTYSLNPNAGTYTAPGNWTNLGPNTYIDTAKDGSGCIAILSLTVSEPAVLAITNFVHTNPLCFGATNGIITSTPTGGNAPYQHSITPPNVLYPLSDTLHAGDGFYTYTVKDDSGCVVTDTFTLVSPTSLSYANLTLINVTCHGANNGIICPNTIGGTLPYTQTIVSPLVTLAGSCFTNLAPGTYTINTTDNQGCKDSITKIITQPTILTLATDSIFNVTCFGWNNGFIKVHAAGGTLPYEYKIDNQPSWQYGIDTFANLYSGIYTITLKDTNGCTAIVHDTIIQPTQIVISNVVSTKVLCYGGNTGTISLSVSGGTQNSSGNPYNSYSFVPNPPGSSIVITGNNFVYNTLTSQTYVITIQDAVTGCTASTNVFVNQNPKIYIDSFSYIMPRCFGESNGSIYVTGAGGVPNYTYSLDAGVIQPIGNVFSGLSSSNHAIHITDAVGCQLDSIVFLPQPAKLKLSNLSTTPVNCENANNGTLTMTAVGGNGDYIYSVQPGVRINRTGDFFNFSVGTYSANVVDTLGCSLDTTFNITLTSNPLSITTWVRNIQNCNGFGTDGQVGVTANGGSFPYTYLWNAIPSTDTAAITTPVWDNIQSGFYVIEVTDAYNCVQRDTVHVIPDTCCTAYLPNAFSPNNDNANDIFKAISANGIEILSFIIVDRWGNKVFNTTDIHTGWDGTVFGQPAENGTYGYMLRYRCLSDKQIYIKKGDVTLIR